MQEIIRISNLTKKIKNNTILDSINLSICEGDIFGIIGNNGSGKSMLFKAIIGLINYNIGIIEIFNKTKEDKEFLSRVGVLIETPGLIPKYSGHKNLRLIASLKKKVTDDEIKDYMNMVELDWDNKPVKKYSLGMKQKLGIIIALMESPKILILDEPTNNLDMKTVNKIREILLELNTKGTTIILSTHNKDDIDILCNKYIKLDNGKIVGEYVND